MFVIQKYKSFCRVNTLNKSKSPISSNQNVPKCFTVWMLVFDAKVIVSIDVVLITLWEHDLILH